VFAGVTAAALPFYPAGWPLGLAATAAALALVRERAGLALALAVPILPFGNLSAGLAWAYAAVALGWLALSWREARAGLLFVVAPLLAPLSLLSLLPLVLQRVRSPVRRAAHACAGLLAAAAVAGLREAPLPFTAAPAPNLDLNRTRDPFAALGAICQALSARPALLLEALVLAAAAAALPLLRRRSIGPFALLLLLGTLLPDPAVPDAAIVAAIVATSLALAAKAEH
jgi:hypothetical protein